MINGIPQQASLPGSSRYWHSEEGRPWALSGSNRPQLHDTTAIRNPTGEQAAEEPLRRQLVLKLGDCVAPRWRAAVLIRKRKGRMHLVRIVFPKRVSVRSRPHHAQVVRLARS